ncbi:SGNH/GDSL hydrolase family protein [Planococcus lenghuensis]|uniref:SGNH/GDSL hydrolase family protein n=1 Tax=Planococcus lenghuensis TaxID=2213202 RepID=A0A1Q2L1A3_9BACL|nr:SGNH/GDSL hydrolase family protein [Planococcus lenghuensis]AQQ54219.1 hypothetical protein B0X71_14685 [Planococcus lenghuensis]
MKLRSMGTALLVLCCLTVLTVSYITYKNKIDLTDALPVPEVTETAVKETEETLPDGEVASAGSEWDSLTANMDESVQQLFTARQEAGESIQFLITGSNTMLDGEPGYAARLKDALEEAYGDLLEVKVISFGGTSQTFSDQFVDLSSGYDVVLLEPFTLKNNGVVAIEDERAAIQKFFGQVQEVTPDAELILHPPQPLFGANYYLTQVDALKEFASLHEYGYINHWDAWPATDDEALKEFLTDSASPNNEGARVWATELIDYFVAQ